MAQVRAFVRITRSKTMTPSAVHGRHVAFMNSTASQALGTVPEVKPYEDIPGPKGIYNWPLIGSMIHFKPFSISAVCYNTRLGFLDPKVMYSQEITIQLKAIRDLFDNIHKSFSDPVHRFFRDEIYRGFERSRHIIRKMLVLETSKQNGTFDPDLPNLVLHLLSDSSLDFMDIVGITDSLLIGGTESTSKNLQTLFYNLAKNPEKQEILRKEIRSVVVADETVTIESLAQLPYLKACVKESFRLLYPTISGTRRQLPTDVVLSGYTVPAGTLITLHNPRACKKYFSNADKFIPERWIRSSDGSHTENIPPTALLPFGSGIRVCVGKRFAEQEIYLATINVLQKLKIGVDSTSWNTDFIYTVFVQPEKPIKFTFTAVDN